MSEKGKWYRCECGYEASSPYAGGEWTCCPRCSGAIYEKMHDVSDEMIKVWQVALYQNNKVQQSYVDNNLDMIMEGILREMTPGASS